MLNDNEKQGAAGLLQCMEEGDLLQLAKTVTNNQIVSRTKNEAIRAIVTFSLSPVDLLKRRKIKREILFRYLVTNSIAVDPKAGKVNLARQVLTHWGTQNVDILDLMEIGDDLPQAAIQPPPDVQPRVPPQQPQNNRNVVPSLVQQSALTLHNNQHLQPQAPIVAHQGGSNQPGSGSWISDFMNFERNVQPAPQDEVMGLEFCRWFYRMLNACNPQGQPFETPFGTQHFFPDAALKVLVTNTNDMENFEGAEAVCYKLVNLVKEDRLMFNANVDVGGVMTMSTPHGLKMIVACGTLHKGSDMIGVFAQQFGVVRNPEKDFNWNIKYTNLKIIAGTPSEQPTLQNPGTVLPIQH